MFSKYFLFLIFVVNLHIIAFNVVYSQKYDVKEYSTSNEFPWIVRILHNGEHLCVGAVVIMSNGLIITPNHCLVNYKHTISNLKVLVRYDDIHERLYDVLEIISHPNYTSFPLIQNDIAFLRIPSNSLFEGKGEGVFATWGCTSKKYCSFNRLMKVKVKVIPTKECSQNYWDVSNANINDEKICAGYFGGQEGESGGGLHAYTKMGTPTLFGILSFASLFDSFNFNSKPPVFTSLSSQLEFINKYVNSSTRKQESINNRVNSYIQKQESINNYVNSSTLKQESINNYVNTSTLIQHGQFLCHFILIFYIFVNSVIPCCITTVYT